MASTSIFPNPGRVNTVSVNTVPVMATAIKTPIIVNSGMVMLRSACL